MRIPAAFGPAKRPTMRPQVRAAYPYMRMAVPALFVALVAAVNQVHRSAAKSAYGHWRHARSDVYILCSVWPDICNRGGNAVFDKSEKSDFLTCSATKLPHSSVRDYCAFAFASSPSVASNQSLSSSHSRRLATDSKSCGFGLRAIPGSDIVGLRGDRTASLIDQIENVGSCQQPFCSGLKQRYWREEFRSVSRVARS